MARKKTGVSLQDIATELGISRNAAALALAGKPGVGDELRRRIVLCAERLGYRSGGQASGARNFLVLVPEFLAGENPFYTHIFSGLEQELKQEGHHLMYASVPPSPPGASPIPAVLRSFEFAGILLIGALPPDYILRVAAIGLPTVLVDNSLAAEPCHAVCIANSHGLDLVTSHLIARGHRDIGFIGPMGLTQGFHERWMGYRRALDRAGLPYDPSVSVTEPWPIDAMHERGRMEAALAALPRLPGAFACLTDMIALSAMAALRDRGLRVPEDISVTGFDDIQAAHLASPALTTYRAPRVEMGREAARLICQLVADPGLPPHQRSLYGSLQERGSVRPPAAGRGA